MQSACITFETAVAGKKCQINVDLSAEYAKPIPAEAMRQILVQVAIKLTNPDQLDSLVAELAPPPAPAPKRTARSAELPPPLLRAALTVLKKKPRIRVPQTL